jgi:hypothetical protein
MVMIAGARLLGVLVCVMLMAASCATPPAKHPDTTPTAVPVDKPPDNPQPQTDTVTTATPNQVFVASDELYRTTFREVQDVVAAITRIIAAEDYDGWISYLTSDFVASRSSADFLAEASNSAVLKKNRIVLKSLKDYFKNVVVRSHLQATLDDIQFLDETHVKALALVQGTAVILYYLVHENGRWKVGLKPAGYS